MCLNSNTNVFLKVGDHAKEVSGYANMFNETGTCKIEYQTGEELLNIWIMQIDRPILTTSKVTFCEQLHLCGRDCGT
jgi:hypothetical protein